MSDKAEKITLAQWDDRYRALCCGGLRESPHGGPLRRHVDEGGDRRLLHLRMDNSAAALRLWNLLLSEESRLRRAREQGVLLVGTMKDLGTVPVMAYALDNVIAFYPDGAWWTPCLMEHNEGLLALADRLGVDDSFCPVRAMLAAMVNGEHFPIPDTLICSVGAVCDDMAAIGQRIDELGFPVFWWEIPHRRAPEPGESSVELPGGLVVAQSQVDFVRDELDRVRRHLETVSGQTLDEARLAELDLGTRREVGGRDAHALDKGAVGAVEIADQVAGLLDHDLAVALGDGGVFDGQVVVAAGTDREGVAVHDKLASLQRAADHQQLGAADAEKVLLVFAVSEYEGPGGDVVGSVLSHKCVHYNACLRE